ncbi:MAG: hypothetical protein CVV05_00340 [Gammaproteobacteria bacterium HGW-Gammaproteobacteria-1]|jgi:ankyrin repeat protein|nr:MAG: hypothetical protein CVV05_00340 [Gammaproteobacteria bacterium HGW-Gammaproteobacteria-1]
MSHAYLAIAACLAGSIPACFNRKDTHRVDYIVSSLLSIGVHPDLPHNDFNPLLRASITGDIDLAITLLQHGASHSYRDWLEGMPPLHHAASNGHVHLVDVYLHAGAEVDAMDIDQWTALHWAACNNHPHIIKHLASAGARLEAMTVSLRTPLHVAARYGQEVAARTLLRLGASPSAQDEDGQTPRDLAATNGHREVVQVLDAWLSVASAIGPKKHL